MQVSIITTPVFISVDGKRFAAKKECIEYERGMPRVTHFRLIKKSMIEALPAPDAPSLYVFGYEHEESWQQQERGRWPDYEPEYVTVSRSRDEILGHVYGALAQVLEHIVADDRFWKNRENSFVRHVGFTDLAGHFSQSVKTLLDQLRRRDLDVDELEMELEREQMKSGRLHAMLVERGLALTGKKLGSEAQ